MIWLEGVLAIFFLVAGGMKLFAHDHMVREFRRFKYPMWLMRLAGGLEVLAAPGLLLGAWMPWWTIIGAAVLCCVMIGATWTNFVKRPPAFGWGTVVILALCALPLVTRMDMIKSLLGTLAG